MRFLLAAFGSIFVSAMLLAVDAPLAGQQEKSGGKKPPVKVKAVISNLKMQGSHNASPVVFPVADSELATKAVKDEDYYIDTVFVDLEHDDFTPVRAWIEVFQYKAQADASGRTPTFYSVPTTTKLSGTTTFVWKQANDQYVGFWQDFPGHGTANNWVVVWGEFHKGNETLFQRFPGLNDSYQFSGEWAGFAFRGVAAQSLGVPERGTLPPDGVVMPPAGYVPSSRPGFFGRCFGRRR